MQTQGKVQHGSMTANESPNNGGAQEQKDQFMKLQVDGAVCNSSTPPMAHREAGQHHGNNGCPRIK